MSVCHQAGCEPSYLLTSAALRTVKAISVHYTISAYSTVPEVMYGCSAILMPSISFIA